MKGIWVSAKANYRTSIFGLLGFLLYVTGKADIASQYIDTFWLDVASGFFVLLVSFLASDAKSESKK